MSQPGIEEILAPKPEARPRVYAYSITDAAHKGHYRYRETVYHITVSQTQAGEAGSLSVDGIEQPGNAIALIDDRREHRVEAGHEGDDESRRWRDGGSRPTPALPTVKNAPS